MWWCIMAGSFAYDKMAHINRHTQRSVCNVQSNSISAESIWLFMFSFRFYLQSTLRMHCAQQLKRKIQCPTLWFRWRRYTFVVYTLMTNTPYTRFTSFNFQIHTGIFDDYVSWCSMLNHSYIFSPCFSVFRALLSSSSHCQWLRNFRFNIFAE